MYKNLRAELARTGKAYSDIAILIQTTNKTVSNKMCGKTEWTVKEMFLIKNSLFPSLTLEYLFSL